MSRIAVGIEYDGNGFAGWQQQAGAPSIQQAVQEALAKVCDHPVEVTAAGRTDAGVHARGQVAHFECMTARTERALVLGANSSLPPAIALRWARFVPDHFHARYSARARTYRYCILNRGSRPALAAGKVAFLHRPLDVAPMREAARHLIGHHDFSAFRAAECQARSPMRELTALEVARHGEFVVLEVTANAFLHHMVRNIAGLLIHIGSGEAAPSLAAELLAARDRRIAPATAPASGLYFWRVHYPPVFGLPDDSDMMSGPAGCPADLLG
jgi:tRNA pseudouridine38-40 synthase